ncbi:hypothetical protein [Vibrio hepatarius]|uniref:hypothetical protein n=1 Tax=Vibrio hepatarius TaxID=171383 RepID=UPI00148B846C|nr:hypothetical protein [Vibrio hepatarius]NOI16368.1 hypothetical protein [Vibrio hepatarius]
MTIIFDGIEYQDIEQLISENLTYSGAASEEALTIPALKAIFKSYALVPREANDAIRQAREKVVNNMDILLSIEEMQDEVYREMVKVGEVKLLSKL